MKRFISIILFTFFTILNAQTDIQQDNRFVKSENGINTLDAKTNGAKDATPADFPIGDPADPVPIDQYVVVLFIVAVGIVLFQSRYSKINLSTQSGKSDI